MSNSGSTLQTTTVVVVTSAAVGIVGAEVFGGGVPLGTGTSAVALTALVIPVTYAGYKLAVSVSMPTASRDNQQTEMSPEEVKQRTAQWSEEAAINPAFPSGQAPPGSSSSQGTPSCPDRGSRSPETREPESRNDNSKVGTSETEFVWQTETDVSFDDIGGMQDLKNKLREEVLTPLEHPERAEQLGVAAPNIVLHGPPGTGKTYTARALAGELGLPFAKLSGADITSKWINESSTKVNDLFTEARQVAANEGGAVVFIDELDSVLKDRSGNGTAHEEDNKVVNEFLNHLEDTKEHNIVFVGATNRLSALSDAGLRSGRVDLKIHIGKPDAAAREAILRAQLSKREHNLTEEQIAVLAAQTDGTVAADLEQIVNRAAKNVLLRGGEVIQPSDIQ